MKYPDNPLRGLLILTWIFKSDIKMQMETFAVEMLRSTSASDMKRHHLILDGSWTKKYAAPGTSLSTFSYNK